MDENKMKCFKKKTRFNRKRIKEFGKEKKNVYNIKKKNHLQ